MTLPGATPLSVRLQEIAASGKLSVLRWPSFSDHRTDFLQLYQASNFSPLWLTASGHLTPQALAVIQALESSRQKGLIPEDYDAARWQGRLAALSTTADPTIQANFEAALTVCTLRYISDLHIGRLNPKHFNFDIEIQNKKYNLPQFVTQDVIHAANVQAILNNVEPPYAGYRRTEVALQRYLQLAAKGDGPLLPEAGKTVAPGDTYPGTAQLTQRLELLGDLSQTASVSADSHLYTEALVDGVKLFQDRHGLVVDGKLGKQTIRQLNVPLLFRVQQLDDALERWRWLPPSFPQPPIVVNVPEFVLRVFSADHKVALRMNVVVGKAVRHQTPVFAKDMQYIVFRLYWNVPRSIVRSEIIPAIVKNRNYIAKKNFEVVTYSGTVVTSGSINDNVLAQLRAAKLTVRQKPGPDNALGLVKFLFPNEHSVYLHGTPAQQLFSQSRRDFSHGCIRVQQPTELAAYLLRDQPPWTPEKVRAAMETGPNNQQVDLKVPIPVLILYITAVVEEDGSVHFFNDIYGHDKSLKALLAKGPPYPG
ncbi:MAG: L,D-transpeptidase family protein [Terriglobia bacterium]|nr:L,D-transpeptidase family protein [Terriglobia bacterium]